MIAEYFNKSKISKGAQKFDSSYNFWMENLMERTTRLFVWSGVSELPKKEIEFALLFNGTAGVTDKYKHILSVFSGMYDGEPTQYYDNFTRYNVHSPVYCRDLLINKDVITGDNNSCRNSVLPLCHKYAVLLAHTDTSIIDTLIMGRENSIPIGSTDTQIESIKNYRNALCNGTITTAILDPAFMGVKFIDTNGKTQLSIKDLVDTRTNLLSSFYKDLGVRSNNSKKERMVVDEVDANDNMLLLNISDMLDCRKDFADRVNKKYGTNWSVDIAEELKYNDIDKEAEDDNN